MIIKGLHLIPVVLFIVLPSTFVGTYIYAVMKGHVEPYFPYISDAGTRAPESCVFGQLINMCSVMLAISVYVRYCHVYQYCVECNFPSKVLTLNKIGVWLGLLSCLGLSLVANFQETNVFAIHIFGAFLCFGLGTIYFWLQAICSYHMTPLVNTPYVSNLRAVLATICSVFFVIMAGCGITAHLRFHGHDPRKWYPTDGGWVLHVISTTSEWIIALCFCSFILSFSNEFRDITIHHPQIQLNRPELLIANTNDEPIS
ncbi:DNA damage-regulated autophagy modulator protein 2 [Nilaparvata lugens]|uniref:DNA damage-regulated autophagy modulator protein 2 n=1 Tax=Nilaparvata lugens TaxID=108931 RepID=UPI00193E4282|nr:DNA damage-regulated autophagy modulator protein 2 [Nilaparvata lugens]